MIRYLTEKELIIINTLQIKTYSPKEQIGVKEPTALNMLVALPKQYVFEKELYPTIEEKAAILYQNLIQKHCFFNANKRTAVVALHTFLRLNQKELKVSEEEMADFTVEVASNKNMTTKKIVHWMKEHS